MLGERIRALRISRGLSGVALAKRVGIKPPSLWEIEHGETKSLKAETLMKLAEALRSNAKYIWTGLGPIAESLDPNTEEAEAASIYRQLNPVNRIAWVAVGHALHKTQPETKPSPDDPYAKVGKQIAKQKKGPRK